MLKHLLLCVALFPATAFSAEVKLKQHGPFDLTPGDAFQNTMNGMTFTVIEMNIVNGDQFLAKIEIRCKATATNGKTWPVSGKALNLAPNQERKFRLVSNNPVSSELELAKASCAVADFKTGY